MPTPDLPNLPKYRIVKVEQSPGWFCAPDLIPVGSVVYTDAPFGPQFEPLNDLARAKQEAWLDEEFQQADRDGKPLFKADGSPLLYKPHRRTNFAPGAPSEPYKVQVESVPKVTEGPKLQTLAEIMSAGPPSTDQRPPPDSYRLPPRDYASASPVVNDEGETLALVAEKAPPTSTVTRKV